MLDPNFRRTVLLLSAHSSADGALGIILNRPLGKKVRDLVNDDAPKGLEDVPVFFGGPVQSDRLTFASLGWENGLKLEHNFGLSEVGEQGGKDTKLVRAFVGYAGWSAGQLEGEMKQNSWVLQKARRSALETSELPKLWFNIMRGLGPWFKLLALAPDDPSLN